MRTWYFDSKLYCLNLSFSVVFFAYLGIFQNAAFNVNIRSSGYIHQMFSTANTEYFWTPFLNYKNVLLEQDLINFSSVWCNTFWCFAFLVLPSLLLYSVQNLKKVAESYSCLLSKGMFWLYYNECSYAYIKSFLIK